MRQRSIHGLLFILATCACMLSLNLSAQISYGGEPWLQQRAGLRAASVPTVVMPPVDTDALREEAELLRTNDFAYKFETHIDLKETAAPVVLSDGRQVWQVRVRSEGALSLNLLFTEYKVPEGASLFIYTSEQVVGRFDHRNNSPQGLLPVRPLSGDDILIEYSEPSDAAFAGKVLIGEVNHGFCDLFEGLRADDEPKADIDAYLCMPDARCEDVDEELIRSTVLLIINGVTTCTGTLINNTSDDETPYLLTAMHCLNTFASVSKDWNYYVSRSGTIVAFFNYDRSVCGTNMRGVEEMSLAVTTPSAINEGKDLALLKFEQGPPAYYNAYYAGWDLRGETTGKPHISLHHPEGAVKKYGLYNKNISLTSYPNAGLLFDAASHWLISSWTVGSTHGGSSGSPLFNRDGLLVGTLTGGNSACSSTKPSVSQDYFSATYTAWETGDPKTQLKTYLDPEGKGTKMHPGLDPNRDNPLMRLSNAVYNQGDEMVVDSLQAPGDGLAFGYNSLAVRRFVEEFDVDTGLEVLGAYLFFPKMDYANVRKATIEVYEGTDRPEILRSSLPFRPQYTGYSRYYADFIDSDRTTLNQPIESFVLFDNPIQIARDKKLFIGYRLAEPTDNNTDFVVYNTWFASPTSRNTAWMNLGATWLPVNQYAAYGNKTALALQALVRVSTGNAIEEVEDANRLRWFYDRESQSLVFDDVAPSEGFVSLYSFAGELIGTVAFHSGDKQVRLPSSPNHLLGIVRVTTQTGCVSRKIIY
ncbi:trypsin-like peptidase domain-containing protein [Bacteroidales bacterium OttesenSCG-928-L03]|nr:trypsin-like peptidase domain-containing protein [Bacteroidales bacterium OttesenSCG-928-L03]